MILKNSQPEQVPALPTSNHGNASREGSSYPELKHISELHNAIIEYMVLHPQARAREVAVHFEISAQYFYILTNTDLFQAQFALKREEIVGPALEKIQDKLVAATKIGLDSIINTLEDCADPVYVRQTTEMVLKSLGYGSKTPTITVKAASGANVQVVSADVIAHAEQQRKAFLNSPAEVAIDQDT